MGRPSSKPFDPVGPSLGVRIGDTSSSPKKIPPKMSKTMDNSPIYIYIHKRWHFLSLLLGGFVQLCQANYKIRGRRL